jgi:hypothetical protein
MLVSLPHVHSSCGHASSSVRPACWFDSKVSERLNDKDIAKTRTFSAFAWQSSNTSQTLNQARTRLQPFANTEWSYREERPGLLRSEEMQ